MSRSLPLPRRFSPPPRRPPIAIPVLFRLCTLAVMLVLGLCTAAAQAQTQPLNDTGITFSADSDSNSSICESTAPDVQDCHNGRDAGAVAGTLSKVGASTLNNGIANGFDYTKISNAGNALPASATLGSGANDWACTRDKVTGLVWEIKTGSGFRSKNDTYSWYDALIPEGSAGTPDKGVCFTAGECDTGSFRRHVNDDGLCGHNDWRIPTVMELQSIVDFGRSIFSVDPTYFPDMPYVADAYFWTGTLYAYNAVFAWDVQFGYGDVAYDRRSSAHYLRLVRAGH